ncbi:MAG: D-alanine--D-alanine ligase [Clostridia bacterium]|nr:D-alanine--D-alanine ligase [Clostridia bacterium]
MKKLGVIFGGVTCEHDVSVVTGLQLIENVDKSKYEIYPIYIHSDGEWYTGKELLNANIYREFEKHEKSLKKAIIPPNKKGMLILGSGMFSKNEFIPLDVVIPAMHGMNGEDGTLQGLLELANIPYTSSGVLGASIGMDKILMKKVYEAHELPVLPYTYFIRDEWNADREAVLNNIEEKLTYPMFVKPSNLGSSIGISKAKDREGLINAIEVAVNYDQRVIVEKGVENLREINCSALGIGDEVEASVCEEPVSWEEFLTFDEKYMRGAKNSKNATGSKLVGSKQGGMANMDRRIPAELPDEITKEIQDLTKKAFKCLHSKGVARIDYIINKDDNKVYINEINTIPGSFSFYLWQYNDMPYSKLIDKLVEIAEKANEEKNKNNYTYKSNIIGNITGIK